jgi:osmotically-inducible protein OsmY
MQANYIGKGPKGYRRTDERIQEEVCDILARHPQIDASDIEVAFTDGIVTLSGTVPDRRMKRNAEREIESVWGVEDVINRIRLADADSDSASERQPERGSTASPNGESDRSGAV